MMKKGLMYFYRLYCIINVNVILYDQLLLLFLLLLKFIYNAPFKYTIKALTIVHYNTDNVIREHCNTV